MHLPTITTLLASAASLTSANPLGLAKRCSPAYDPELAGGGYYPPAPCWQTFDPSCTPYLASNTEQTINAKYKSVVVYGVSTYCGAEIAEELAREKVGRKNYGWVKQHGALTYVPGSNSTNGILVISNMTDAAITKYQRLTYLGPPWGTGPGGGTTWE